jgi:polar amino acid transport system substrate-binding protein
MHTLSGVMILGRLIDQSQLLAVRKEMERDQSTGIYNKSVIMERLHTEMERANRHQYALSVLFFDIDNFKQFNDQYGHQFGDEIIKEVIGAISTRKRDTDLLGRFGGDEFLLICPECNAKQAESLSKDVLNILKQGNQEVTLSIGIVQMELEEKPGDVLLKADLAMYEAKQLGKNRAVTAGLLRPANQS